jgi:hypothetical protein
MEKSDVIESWLVIIGHVWWEVLRNHSETPAPAFTDRFPAFAKWWSSTGVARLVLPSLTDDGFRMRGRRRP